MRKFLLLIFVLAAVVAAFWLLPWWLSVTLVVVVVLPLAWVAWKFISMLRRVAKEFADVIPKKRQVHPPGEQGDSMLIVSTIPKDEMKAKTNEKLDAIYSQVQEVQADELGP